MVTVEAATAADAAEIARILGEIEAYYGGDPVPVDLEQIHTALFGDHPAARVLLARDGSEVLGLAAYSRIWPAAGADESFYLKELFVRSPARRRGVGRALMDAVRAAAVEAGCSRLEWTADRDNPPALELYEALGMKPHDGKIFYRTEF